MTDSTHLASLVKGIYTLYSRRGPFEREEFRAIYADHAVFEDPIHRCEGLTDLLHYANAVYGGVEACHFEQHAVWIQGDTAFTTWTLTLRHPSLNGGKTFSLPGLSHLQGHERIHYHRDYYDLGAMLYEKVPVLGPVNRWLKRRLSS